MMMPLRILAVLSLLSMVSSPAVAEPRQLYMQPSALVQLAEYLGGAPDSTQAHFAALVLESLVDAYRDELEQAAMVRADDTARAHRIQRWRQAMDLELQRLQRFQASLMHSREASVEVERQGQILLMVEGAPLLVSWPRVAAQVEREAAIVRRFCALHDCPRTAEPGAPRPVADPVEVRGAWSFTQQGGAGWESEDGVRCAFPDLGHRAERETLCRRVVAELQTLAAALAGVRRDGALIEWSRLVVADEPGAGMQRVTVNARGDYLLVPLPALVREAVDWRAASRWLARQLDGIPAAETVLHL